MKNIATLTLCTSLLFTLPALAGSGSGHSHGHGHSHAPLTSEQVEKKASQKVQSLVDAEKIDASWAGLKPDEGTEQKVFSHDPEWVVVFSNEEVEDLEKQKLYLFYSLSGKYIAANYTGE